MPSEPFLPNHHFLDYQHALQHAKGNINAHMLLGVQHIPCDNQVGRCSTRSPQALAGVFLTVFAGLGEQGLLHNLHVLNDQLLMALDGTQYFEGLHTSGRLLPIGGQNIQPHRHSYWFIQLLHHIGSSLSGSLSVA